MKRVAILDRDGTLIDIVRDEETGTLTTAFHPDQIRLLDGAVEGLLALQHQGFALAIATNQPGPAKGHFTAAAVHRTNAALVSLLSSQGVEIVSVKVCMHHPVGGKGGDASLVGPCACRKPKGGLLDEIVSELSADRGSSWMIGDSMADVEAARAARISAGLVFALNRCELCPLREAARSLEPAPSSAWRVPDVYGVTVLDVAEKVVAKAIGRAAVASR